LSFGDNKGNFSLETKILIICNFNTHYGSLHVGTSHCLIILLERVPLKRCRKYTKKYSITTAPSSPLEIRIVFEVFKKARNKFMLKKK